MVRYSNFDRGMESGDHFKNGASSKSQMSRRIFSFFYFIVATVMLFFPSCSNNDLTDDNYVIFEENPTSDNLLLIKAYNVEGGSSKDIAFAKVVIVSFIQSPNGEYNWFEYSTKYENAGFKLTFPKTISDEYLQRLSETVLEGVQISDTQAKIRSAYVEAHNNAEANIGVFSFRSDNCGIGFLYADRNFTMKGVSGFSGSEFDCSFKKGWNIVYFLYGGKKQTTQKPKNEIFKCYFSRFFVEF